MAEWFDELGVKYIPRVIGDSGNKSDLEDGTAHAYNEEQMEWFKIIGIKRMNKYQRKLHVKAHL